MNVTQDHKYSSNHAYYFGYTPVTYTYIPFFNGGFPVMKWNETNIPYTLNLPNGNGKFDYGFFDGDFKGIGGVYDNGYQDIFINNGEIFMNYFPFSQCPMYFPPGDECSFWEVYANQSACCNNYVYIDIPDYQNEICESFHSDTVLKDSQQAIIATLNASYFIHTNTINLNVTDYKLYNHSINMRYGIGGDIECVGNSGSPQSFCAFYFPDDTEDIKFNFLIDFEWADQNDDIYGFYATAGILARRNGIFLKDDNSLFTSKNPCWKKSAEIAYGNGANFESSFCCTSFKSASHPTVSPSPTPTSSSACLTYYSTTTVTNNSTNLKVSYMFNTTGLMVNIANYSAETNSSVQIEVYSHNSFSQPCNATTENPKNQCFFELSDNKKYELKMRTSIWRDGFDMLSITENNGKLTSPPLSSTFPCHNETNPYNNGNSNLNATTIFCCEAFESL